MCFQTVNYIALSLSPGTVTILKARSFYLLVKCSVVDEHNKYNTILRMQKAMTTNSNDVIKHTVNLDIFEEYKRIPVFCLHLPNQKPIPVSD